MPTDFKYMPQNPDPISGVEVLKQTERAINELGGEIDAGNETANEALQVANSALTSATNAVNIATSAGTTAQNALSQVEALTPRVTAAEGGVVTAQATANTAINNAAIAQSTASAAQSTASAAQSTANAAQASANTAQITAEAVQATANLAQDSANAAYTNAEVAKGIYETDDTESLDANTYYKRPQRVYVTGSTPQNFPSEIDEPIWFSIFITDESNQVIQECHDSSSVLIYTRVGSVNNSDPENITVIWSPWNTVATPEVIKSVNVEVNPAGQPAGTYLVIVSNTTSGDVTSYVNLTQILSEVYTAGNGGISISTDYKISLQLDPNNSQGLTVHNSGLQTLRATETMPGVIRIATEAEVRAANNETAAVPPAKANAAAHTAPSNRYINTAQDFNSYTTPGLWCFGPSAHTNGPPCMYADGVTMFGGMLRVTAIFNAGLEPPANRVTQEFIVWQNSVHQSVTYTRGYHHDSNVWGPWVSNGHAPAWSRAVTYAEYPTAASPLTMAYSGYISVIGLITSGSTSYVQLWVNSVLAQSFHIGAASSPSYSPLFAPVAKGDTVHIRLSGSGVVNRFLVIPTRGGA